MSECCSLAPNLLLHVKITIWGKATNHLQCVYTGRVWKQSYLDMHVHNNISSINMSSLLVHCQNEVFDPQKVSCPCCSTSPTTRYAILLVLMGLSFLLRSRTVK